MEKKKKNLFLHLQKLKPYYIYCLMRISLFNFDILMRNMIKNSIYTIHKCNLYGMLQQVSLTNVQQDLPKLLRTTMSSINYSYLQGLPYDFFAIAVTKLIVH